MGPHEKTWTDQPDEVTSAPIIAQHIRLQDSYGEIRRRDDGRYYISAGNLFGSETVLCDSAAIVLGMLGMMANENLSRPLDLPSGVYLVQKRKKVA